MVDLAATRKYSNGDSDEVAVHELVQYYLSRAMLDVAWTCRLLHAGERPQSLDWR